MNVCVSVLALLLLGMQSVSFPRSMTLPFLAYLSVPYRSKICHKHAQVFEKTSV